MRARGPPALLALLKMGAEVARGMDYLHKRRVVHRDLKAANLLLDDAGCVKIADFGVARLLDAGGGVMTAETGTYRWMAPEIITHAPYDEKADVYSYGILLWELLTGKRREREERGVSFFERFFDIVFFFLDVARRKTRLTLFFSSLSPSLSRSLQKQPNRQSPLRRAHPPPGGRGRRPEGPPTDNPGQLPRKISGSDESVLDPPAGGQARLRGDQGGDGDAVYGGEDGGGEEGRCRERRCCCGGGGGRRRERRRWRRRERRRSGDGRWGVAFEAAAVCRWRRRRRGEQQSAAAASALERRRRERRAAGLRLREREKKCSLLFFFFPSLSNDFDSSSSSSISKRLLLLLSASASSSSVFIVSERSLPPRSIHSCPPLLKNQTKSKLWREERGVKIKKKTQRNISFCFYNNDASPSSPSH